MQDQSTYHPPFAIHHVSSPAITVMSAFQNPKKSHHQATLPLYTFQQPKSQLTEYSSSMIVGEDLIGKTAPMLLVFGALNGHRYQNDPTS